MEDKPTIFQREYEESTKYSPEKEQISQTVKDQWEREQTELKKQMISGDVKEVREMLLSCRPDSTSTEYYVGGVDISFIKGDNENACAAFIVLSFPKLEVVYEDCQMIKLTAPYIPGFLAFREASFLVDMYKKLVKELPQYAPQVIMVDGNGILHPREFGLACHLGVLLDTPCIGVAKKLFQVDGLENNDEHHLKIDQLKEGGDTFPLVGTSGKILGKALRSCTSTSNPIYISTGHKITLDSAVELVHRCCQHRIPEPTRQADMKSREYLRDHFGPESQRPKNKGQKQKTKSKSAKTEKQQPVTKCSEFNVEDLFESSCSLFDEDGS